MTRTSDPWCSTGATFGVQNRYASNASGPPLSSRGSFLNSLALADEHQRILQGIVGRRQVLEFEGPGQLQVVKEHIEATNQTHRVLEVHLLAQLGSADIEFLRGALGQVREHEGFGPAINVHVEQVPIDVRQWNRKVSCQIMRR